MTIENAEVANIFTDPNIPDELKARMILCLLKARDATDVYKMRDALVLLISILDECIALDKKKES